MADSTRKLIIIAIGSAFDNVQIFGQFPTVFYAQQSLIPEELPAVIVTPDVEEGTRRYGQDLLTMPVIVSATVAVSGRPVVEATEDLLALLRETVPRALEAGIGALEDIQYKRGGVEEWPEVGGQSATVFGEFHAIYTTDANQSK